MKWIVEKEKEEKEKKEEEVEEETIDFYKPWIVFLIIIKNHAITPIVTIIKKSRQSRQCKKSMYKNKIIWI